MLRQHIVGSGPYLPLPTMTLVRSLALGEASSLASMQRGW